MYLQKIKIVFHNTKYSVIGGLIKVTYLNKLIYFKVEQKSENYTEQVY